MMEIEEFQTKICSKCGEIKDIEFFPKKGNICKKCEKDRQKNWYKANHLKILETKRKYREANPEQMKEWRKNNPEKIKEYREKNKDKINKSIKKWKELNKDKILEQRRNLYKINHNRFLEQARNWRKNNPDKVKAFSKKSNELYKEIKKASQKKWKEAHPDKVKKYKQKGKDLISDCYVRTCLRLKKEQVPSSFIELKRIHLKIIRVLKKEKDNENN